MIHVIGAGGTGGWLIPAIIKMVAVPDIRVWDADKVEEKNISRQNFYPDQVGMFKAQAMEDTYGIVNSRLEYLDDEQLNEIRTGDTVIICADNYHVRAIIAERARVLPSITIINAGNEEYTTSTQIHVKRDGLEYTPAITYMHPEIVRGKTAQELACAEVANLPGGEQTVAANMLSAALALTALIMVRKWDSSPLRPDSRTPLPWHDLSSDIMRGKADHTDWRIDGAGDWQDASEPR